MVEWNFSAYVGPNGRNEVQSTIDGYDDYDHAKFARAVAHLAVTPKVQWNRPFAAKLKNEDPIYEIRYQANRRETRPLGFFASDGVTFVIVLICYKKGSVYAPPGAFKSAHSRIAQLEDGTATTVPLQINGEDFPAHEEKPDSP